MPSHPGRDLGNGQRTYCVQGHRETRGDVVSIARQAIQEPRDLRLRPPILGVRSGGRPDDHAATEDCGEVGPARGIGFGGGGEPQLVPRDRTSPLRERRQKAGVLRKIRGLQDHGGRPPAHAGERQSAKQATVALDLVQAGPDRLTIREAPVGEPAIARRLKIERLIDSLMDEAMVMQPPEQLTRGRDRVRRSIPEHGEQLLSVCDPGREKNRALPDIVQAEPPLAWLPGQLDRKDRYIRVENHSFKPHRAQSWSLARSLEERQAGRSPPIRNPH